MTINIFELFKKQKITNVEDGNRVFNLLKKNLEENPKDFELNLDMKNIVSFSVVSFQTLFGKMRKNLNGNITVKVLNQNVFINQTFKKALNS